LLATGCLSVVDPRCSTDNCQTLAECRVTVEGVPREPALALCGDYDVDALLQLCVDACEADGAGAAVQCVASNFGASCVKTNGSLPTFSQIDALCGSPSPSCGPNCTSCSDACATTESTCDQRCAGAADGGCLECEYQCSQQGLSCTNACPTN
jgi:hypothetical protein